MMIFALTPNICNTISLITDSLQHLFEFFDSQPAIFDYASHCIGVNRIISWNGDEMNSI